MDRRRFVQLIRPSLQFIRTNGPLNQQPLTNLKFIGPVTSQRFRRRRINNLQQLVNYFNRHSKLENRQLMQEMLRNERAGQCIGRPKFRNRRYEVRQYRLTTWNAIIEFVRDRRRVNAVRIPNSMPFLGNVRKYPVRCVR